MTLKEIVQGTADLSCVLSGGIAVYILTDINGKKYQIEIDLSDRHDVGETATFALHYDKAIYLMRWIRRAMEHDKLIALD
jgi:hypothetical protein